ncbi:MAG TPA: hypothetical protein VEW68_09055 [Patescibacteria group bacterium]|nr:hypothetical protein [Patescibacteria group bacterium]
MSTELRETAAAIEEVAAEAAKTARKVASGPVRSARRQVRVIERRGTRVARRINRRFNAQVRAIAPEGVTVWGLELNGRLPERAAVKGLHQIRVQAHREDRMGEVAKRALHMLNRGFKTIVRVATHLEEASELTPHHAAAVKPSRPRVARRRAVRRAA